ncbi:WXG100 family type VII secretion target [Actinomadura oligospora]|uniref:WXG100 family type VII secretion target n=1 Tax=Actinomadura oligospora TaxID=111804 RepID=UPI00047ECABF|nr:WXG100 family type VII secretion target [Actinomadura oligospora]
MSYTYVNFGGMQNGQQNFLAALKQYQSTLDQLDAQVRAHLAEWDGDARQAYEAKSREWKQAAQRMATAVSGMSQAIGDSHDIHLGAERTNAGMWGG